MDVEKYGSEQIRWMVAIHLVCVVSGVLLAAIGRTAVQANALKRAKATAGPIETGFKA